MKKKEHCPHCAHELGLTSGVMDSKHKPEPGAITVCLYCQRICIYTDEMKLRKFTPEEMKQLIKDNSQLAIEIIKAQSYAREYILRKQAQKN